jgi:hypothetical protein
MSVLLAPGPQGRDRTSSTAAPSRASPRRPGEPEGEIDWRKNLGKANEFAQLTEGKIVMKPIAAGLDLKPFAG